MSYLHSRDVAHRDLKSLNILIKKGKGTCMISDFGLSKEEDGATATNTVGTLGTPAWSAPEVLLGQASSTGAAFMADAYSFGVIVWEIHSGQLPWAGMPPLQVAITVTQERRQLEIPPGCPPEIKALLAACFEHDPALRPTMEEVEADFPEQDEPTPAYKAAFTHELAAYTLSSQLTLQSQTSTEAVRTPQMLDVAVTPTAALPTLFDVSAHTDLVPPARKMTT